MIVSELIEKLQQFPSDHRVFVNGYEDGIDDVSMVREVKAKLNVNPEHYYRDHEEIQDNIKSRYGKPDSIGVLIQ